MRISSDPATLLTVLTVCLRLPAACLLGAMLLQGAPAVIGLGDESPTSVRRFAKFEVDFLVTGVDVSNAQWPYDPAPPAGVVPGAGVSVDGVFIDPEGRRHIQPAFYGRDYRFEVREERDWIYPTNLSKWKLRFAPDQVGVWTYQVRVSSSEGETVSAFRTLVVGPSDNPGFIRPSEQDPRYFAFDDDSLFFGQGLQLPEFLVDPMTKGHDYYAKLAENGVHFGRIWLSSIYGTAWTPYVGGRNHYRGYLPTAGIVPIAVDGQAPVLAMRLDYEPDGDLGWFDACRLNSWDAPEAVLPGKTYRVRVVYNARGIDGPRRPGSPNFGLTVKLGGFHSDCYEPGGGLVVTNYGGNTVGWSSIEGRWHSGSNNFLPRFHLALENVSSGVADVAEISLREELGDGRLGPEILTVSSMQFDRVIHERRAAAFDRMLETAEQVGLYLKVVLNEKDDELWFKLNDNGSFAMTIDNQDGFYGLGRKINRTRWLQQAWWRYVQARWGYSPNIHSWELLNEGDPTLETHYEAADEFARFMHRGAIGIDAEQTCTDGDCSHPNEHMATTSFWGGLPASFWNSPAYPWLDYIDIHAYVSTSFAPAAQKERMKDDAALYHLWHSDAVRRSGAAKPAVRGEAGLDLPNLQSETASRLDRDAAGVWFHNFLWSTLDAGALQEIYWWRSHVWAADRDYLSEFKRLQTFLSGIELHRGGFKDWGGEASSPDLRVVGQKNLASGQAHLWIQNKRHTWANVVADSVEPVSGVISVSGWRPRGLFTIERWNTYDLDIKPERFYRRSDSRGVLTVSVRALADDVALKIYRCVDRGTCVGGDAPANPQRPPRAQPDNRLHGPTGGSL